MKFLMIALLASASIPVAASAPKPLQANDIYDLSMVTNPVVSPDGTRVLFTRAAFDQGSDRRTGELWLAHVDASGQIIDKRLLVARDVSPRQAVWSPDGSRIAYVANHLGKGQIHVLALADGIGKPVTRGEYSPIAPVWSPDGTKLAFTAHVEAKPQSIAGLPEKPKGMNAAPDAKIINDLFWRADGAGEIKPGAMHLFTVEAATGETVQLTAGDTHQISAGGLDWTKDGRAIIGEHQPDPINGPRESDLYLYSASLSNNKPVPPTRLTSRAGSESAPKVSPDGKSVAFLGSEADSQFYDQTELWRMELKAGAPITQLSKALDRTINSFDWSADGQSFSLMYHDRGTQKLAQMDANTGATRELVSAIGGTRLYLPSAGGQGHCAANTCAWTTAFTDRPTGLGISKGGAQTGAIDFNAEWAKTRKASKIEEITVASRADGTPVQGWIAYPPDFDPKKKYPVILDIHGGPNSDYGPYFSITHGLYAAAGYLVLFTNPRGSIGYGDAFANAITNAYPGQDHDDLMTMVDALAERPYADKRNLFIGGGSGGGVLTLWAIGKEPEKFRAAVALRPVTDWLNQVTTSDGTAFFMKHWMGVTPWDKPEVYWQRSPISLVGQIQTPTLLITGEDDFRTPMSQTEQVFGALKLRGVDTTMIRLPGAGHGMGRPSQWIQSVLAPIAYFEKYKAK